MSIFIYVLASAVSAGAFSHAGIVANPPVAHASRILVYRKMAENGSSDEPDLFEYFDPLLSPHAYPDGVSPDNKPLSEDEIKSQTKDGPSVPFGFRLEETTELDASSSSTELNPSDFASRGVSPDVFDPTISPHAYSNGTPDVVIGDKGSSTGFENSNGRIGILFIDHGSRNQKSNQRLHSIAQMYQDQFGSSNTIVRAAHMEIAEPSIPEVLQVLLEEDGVDEIVCHPFFLSPDGRHVSEDIPRIVEGAKKDLNIEIPISTTEPVGSEVFTMLQAVDSLVKRSVRS